MNRLFRFLEAVRQDQSVNVGFFRGAELADAAGILEGTGKYMRHVKLRPGEDLNAEALKAMIEFAYVDMKARLGAE